MILKVFDGFDYTDSNVATQGGWEFIGVDDDVDFTSSKSEFGEGRSLIISASPDSHRTYAYNLGGMNAEFQFGFRIKVARLQETGKTRIISFLDASKNVLADFKIDTLGRIEKSEGIADKHWHYVQGKFKIGTKIIEGGPEIAGTLPNCVYVSLGPKGYGDFLAYIDDFYLVEIPYITDWLGERRVISLDVLTAPLTTDVTPVGGTIAGVVNDSDNTTYVDFTSASGFLTLNTENISLDYDYVDGLRLDMRTNKDAGLSFGALGDNVIGADDGWNTNFVISTSNTVPDIEIFAN